MKARSLAAVRHFTISHSPTLLGLLATVIYLLTMDRSASWWDCGEFITTNLQLGVGHPPGAPFYQLLAHIATLLSFGNPLLVAPMSNALSAIAAGATVGLLYSTILELGARHRLGAAIGAMCYLFCDTAWFSAVESEVYALAMLLCSAEVYTMLRWRRTGNTRLLLLTALMAGLGVCVHLMTLLTIPALLLIAIKYRDRWPKPLAKTMAAMIFFFAFGLSPYIIVPLRAAANPPINEMGESFKSYVKRDQYTKAPLFPRMWRKRDEKNWHNWTIKGDGIVANTIYCVGYQLGFMYGRYWLYNFVGRENLKHKIIVVFVLPALLGLLGLWRHRKTRREDYWIVMLLLLFGGVILNIYLNHPCYEPRERDYVYVLSFYAFAAWIGIGASEAQEKLKKGWKTLLIIAPLSMAAGNWSDHDRHALHSVHDLSMAHLESCDHGAILITLGDNDTFPLWYLQQVEKQRTDIEIHNIGLTGYRQTMNIINDNLGKRPVYVSQYFYTRYAETLGVNNLRCEGLCWRILTSDEEKADDREPLERHIAATKWHITEGEYMDKVSTNLMKSWRKNTGCE